MGRKQDLDSGLPANIQYCRSVSAQCFRMLQEDFPGEPKEKTLWRLLKYGQEKIKIMQAQGQGI